MTEHHLAVLTNPRRYSIDDIEEACKAALDEMEVLESKLNVAIALVNRKNQCDLSGS